MRKPAILLAAVLFATSSFAADAPQFDEKAAERFANLALACVHKEYPNHVSHTLSSDKDARPPRELTPAFYGCYDWHSCVHGHWLLARLARTYPDAPFAAPARKALGESLTKAHIEKEVKYLQGAGRASFERPYGLAWLLQLGTELHEWNDPQAQEWSANLMPLEEEAAKRLSTWLPKLTNPVRIGEHDQTAFGLGLALDWARATNHTEFASLIESRAKAFFLADKNCPINYEPSGEDFLSPCIAEADLMRRILPKTDYAAWLGSFLPYIPLDGSATWITPGVVTDPSDPKLAHLDGLNLSRAWMLEGTASGLPEGDPRIKSLLAAAATHRAAGIAGVTGEHYEGGHWLGSFATYLVTQRGLQK